MYDVSLLMKANSRIQKRRPILQDGHFIFVSDEPFFDEYALAEFMAFCNRIVHGGYPKGIPVIVQFTKEIKFEEKLMFILLECVCKYLISEGHPVSLNMKIHPEINTHGFESSPLKLLESSTYGNTDRFKEKFSKDLFEFPNQIVKVASSFVQGLFSEIVKNVGMDAIGEKIVIRAATPKLEASIMGNLL